MEFSISIFHLQNFNNKIDYLVGTFGKLEFRVSPRCDGGQCDALSGHTRVDTPRQRQKVRIIDFSFFAGIRFVHLFHKIIDNNSHRPMHASEIDAHGARLPISRTIS